MPANIVDIVIDMATAIGYEADDDVDENSRFTRAVARMEAAYQKDQSKIEVGVFTEGKGRALAVHL
jgi:hypothetical protein